MHRFKNKITFQEVFFHHKTVYKSDVIIVFNYLRYLFLHLLGHQMDHAFALPTVGMQIAYARPFKMTPLPLFLFVIQ